MSRLTFVNQRAAQIAVRVAGRFNPITRDPAAPLKTVAMVESFGPSLMPRASMHQGMAAGLAVLVAEATGKGVDAAIRRVLPTGSPLLWRIGARVVVASVGLGVSRIKEKPDESTTLASVRAAGRITTSAAIGGAIYEGGNHLRDRYPATGPLRPIVGGAAGFAAALVYSGRLLDQRKGIIERWSEDDKPAQLLASVGIGLAVVTAGRGIGRRYLATRRGFANYFGDDIVRRQVGRTVNAAVWAGGAAMLYNVGVGYIARSNEKIEPAYSEPPQNEYVSGGPHSLSPFSELGVQGRRYVTDVVTPEVIAQTLGDTAEAHPVRAYIGYNSEPIYVSGRSEMALDELERLGAFDREYLLLFSPTGTGWVDQTVIESAEILARGNIATCCVQYGRSPSFLALHKVALGRMQFRQLLWGVRQRLADRPPSNRPKVLVFGESLGAWSSSDVVMDEGIAGFDRYGIDRALWFGLPGLAKWSKTGMREGSGDTVPEGTVRAFDNPGQLAELTEDELRRLRAVVLDHDNDPIAQVSLRLAVKRPPWLNGEQRGRGVPQSMTWSPLITFVQVVVDAMNAMKVIPGEFKSFGHDYRGDTAEFVHAAYQLPAVTDDQMASVVDTLRQRELDRGERIQNAKEANTEDETLV